MVCRPPENGSDTISLARRHLTVVIVGGATAAFLPGITRARTPESSRLLLPFSPNGPTEMVGSVPATRVQRAMQAAAKSSLSDLLAGVLARMIEAHLGQPVQVERIAVAARAVAGAARDARDARTLMLVSEALCVFAAVADEAIGGAIDRLLPVATCVQVPYLAVASGPGKPGATAQAAPGAGFVPGRRCVIASAGYGGRSSQLARALVRRLGEGCREASFNGGASALTALLGGQVDAAMLPLPLVAPWLADGTLQALAAPASPQVDSGGWFAILASPGWTLIEVDRLSTALGEALRAEPIASYLNRLGMVAKFETRQQLAGRIASERRIWLAEKKSGAL